MCRLRPTGCIMSRFKKCNVIILDNTDKCPLCHHVLEQDGNKKENMYPDARVAGRKYRKLENIFLFVSVVIWILLFAVDYFTNPEFLWSFTVALAIIYANVLLRLTILGKSTYLTKIVWTILIALVFLIEADILTGYHGWGVNFAFPTAVIALDIGILILMLVNKRNWQSYIIVQVGALLLSGVMLVLMWIGVITSPYYAIVAQIFSLLIFLGTMIIGDKRARTELWRRFHI